MQGAWKQLVKIRFTPYRRIRRAAWLAVLVAICTAVPLLAQSSSWQIEAGDVVYGVALSGDAGLQVVGSRNNRVVALDPAGDVLWEFQPQGTVWGVATSEDGSKTAVAAEDRRVYLLDNTGQLLWEYRDAFIFLDVAMSRDGSLVAAIAEDRKVYAIDGESGALLWQFALPNVADTVAVYGAENARVLAGTRDSQVHLLNTDGSELWRVQLSRTVQDVASVQSGARVVAGLESGEVVLFNGANTQTIWHVQLPGAVNAVDITADGSAILAGTQAGMIYLLDGESGAIRQSQDAKSPIEAVAISPDGRYFMLGTRAGQARFADVEAAATEFAARQRVRTGLQIGIPLVVVLFLIGFVLWVRVTAAGGQFWAVQAAPSRHLGAQMWRSRVSYFFLLPTVTLLLIFNYYPAASGLYHAFTIWKPGVETRWVGLQQFYYILEDQYFWIGIKNTVILVIASYVKTFTMPLLVAELIFHIRSRFLQYGMRTLFTIPLVVPAIVGILVWVNIYDPNIGLLNQTLQALGLDAWTQVWLGNERTALWSIIAIGFPWVSPFAFLIFYGGLISIPQELIDATKVDGASTWMRFWKLDLPLLMSQIKLLLILGFIGSIQEFQLIFLTTGGGPGNVTYTPALELYYQAVRFNNFGLASAIGAVLFVVILAGTTLYMRYVTSAVEYEA